MAVESAHKVWPTRARRMPLTPKRALVVGAIGLLIVLAALASFLLTRGPDLSAYERYREPAVLTMPSQRMLTLEFTGDPDTEGSRAMSGLFEIYFRLDGVPKGPGMPAPRGRWPVELDSPKAEWIGSFALPIPDNAGGIPPELAAKYPTARIETWEYGEVAQILHVGPYTTEEPTIDRLRDYIRGRSYHVIGEHEEEYLRGPGVFGVGSPKDYYTLIRYRVRD